MQRLKKYALNPSRKHKVWRPRRVIVRKRYALTPCNDAAIYTNICTGARGAGKRATVSENCSANVTPLDVRTVESIPSITIGLCNGISRDN